MRFRLENAVEATVVIPALNAAGTLDTTLRALDRQTIRDRLRVIVVDNGSEDATVSIAGGLADEVISVPTPGVAHARNAGLEQCGSPWMLTTDADTRPRPDWAYEHLISLTECDDDVVGTAGMTVPFPSSSWWAQREDVTPQPRFERGVAQYAVTLNAAFRTELVRELGGFPPYLADDAAFGSLARSAGYRFLYVPRAVVEHRNPATARTYYLQMRKVGRYAAELDAELPSRRRIAAQGVWRTLKVTRHFFAGRFRHGAAETLKSVGVTAGALSLASERRR